MELEGKELFGELNRYLVTAPPGSRIAISHLWANNTNALGEFFLDPDDLQRVDWIVMDDILRERIVEAQPTTVFVLTPRGFEQTGEIEILDCPCDTQGWRFYWMFEP